VYPVGVERSWIARAEAVQRTLTVLRFFWTSPQGTSLLPTCRTKFYKYNSVWEKLYSEDFTGTEKEKIVSSLQKAIGFAGAGAETSWGERIEDQGSQITLSALEVSRLPWERKGSGIRISPSGG
jgi:hypothetical protein